MTRLEIIDAVKRIVEVDGSEEDIHVLIRCLKAAVPRAGISDLIFYSDQDRDPEQIVDEALRRQKAYTTANVVKR